MNDENQNLQSADPINGEQVAPGANADDEEVEDPYAGLTVPPRPEQSEADNALAYEVEEAMFEVIDPELGINVIDLGLVYDIWIEEGSKAIIHMTLTSPACPLTDMLTEQTRSEVMQVDGVEDFDINWVWSPPWGPQMITEDGREQLRAFGMPI